MYWLFLGVFVALFGNVVGLSIVKVADMAKQPTLSSKDDCVARCMGDAGKGISEFILKQDEYLNFAFQDECESKCSSTLTLASKHIEHKEHVEVAGMTPRTVGNKSGVLNKAPQMALTGNHKKHMKHRKRVKAAGMKSRLVVNKHGVSNRASSMTLTGKRKSRKKRVKVASMKSRPALNKNGVLNRAPPMTLTGKHKNHKKRVKVAGMRSRTAISKKGVLNRAPPHSVSSPTQQCEVDCVGNKELITQADIAKCKATCSSTKPVTLVKKVDVANRPKLWSSKENCVRRCMGMPGRGIAEECESRCSGTMTLTSKNKKHKKHKIHKNHKNHKNFKKYKNAKPHDPAHSP